ncbi:GTP-binding protein At3g49725, chloroplastic [Phalaenopsis equestris]|uniref:GTP-binding protein At3g49725, chloroplastic n=1 Tax=Phalaenopsis equestris TaxID=78828 RepID=UPI0009E4B4F5|nr:GTP-binding protein At3g49725, chloroplastic [Phalaenopsis equestris]
MVMRIVSRVRPPTGYLCRSLNPPPLFPIRAPIPVNSPSPFGALFSSFRKRKGSDEEREEGKEKDVAVPGVFLFANDLQSPPRLFVVQPRVRPESILDLKLSEALNLAKSLEEPRGGFVQADFTAKQISSHLVVQNPIARSSKSHADTYFGPGTVDNIKTHLKALESEDHIDAVFVNATLSGIQQRNLEISWGKPVLDRVGLIIEIFNSHAETKEAKLQSELAALMYKRSRLVRVRGSHGRLTFGISGEAEVVSARGRGSGGRGFISGAGETELQLQRRRIQERRNQLLTEIDEVRRTRALQRSARKRRGGLDGHSLTTVAVVGYTNAGKSTLVSALSNSHIYSDDRLFATVDPRLRSVFLPSGRKTLLSDTVGFISDLPVQLVEAFHATLEEVVEADLLLHVLDSSAPNVDEQRSSVLEVLQKIGVSEEKIQNMIEVWNKIDLLNKNLGTTQDEARGEAEEERNGDRSEDLKEENEAQLKEDGILPKFSEGMRSNQMACSDLDESNLSFDLSPDDDLDVVDGQISRYTDVQKMKFNAHCEQEVASRIETSAITGVGLKELLSLISEKLSAQKLIEKKSYEPFNRKWRPSHNLEFNRAVEQ